MAPPLPQTLDTFTACVAAGVPKVLPPRYVFENEYGVVYDLQLEGVYLGTPDEYVGPPKPLRPTTWAQAQERLTAIGTGLGEGETFDSIPFYWAGVRGAGWSFPDRDLEKLYSEPTGWAELAPVPGNPWDNTAVRIDYLGLPLGYVSANAAWRIHSRVRQLNCLGYRVEIPVTLSFPNPDDSEYTLAAYAALPTDEHLDSYLAPLEERIENWRAPWEQLGDVFRTQVNRDNFHLTHMTVAQLMEWDVSRKLGLPALPVPDAVPHDLRLFLRDRRQEAYEAAARAREAKIAQARELRAGGAKYASIGRKLGVSGSTVSAWLRTPSQT